MDTDDPPYDVLPEQLATPARRALASVGVTRLRQLTAFREDEIRSLHGIGPNALRQLRDALAARRLTYKA